LRETQRTVKGAFLLYRLVDVVECIPDCHLIFLGRRAVVVVPRVVLVGFPAIDASEGLVGRALEAAVYEVEREAELAL